MRSRHIHGRRARAWVTLGFLTLVSGWFLATLYLEAQTPTLSAGSEIPDIPVVTPDGRSLRLREILHGTSLVVFFNTQCHHCAVTLDNLARLSELYRDTVHILHLSLSTAAETREWAQVHHSPSPLFTADPSEARRTLGIRTVPALMLLEHLTVRQIRYGAGEFKDDEALVGRLLERSSMGPVP
jgi:peroxiredoxin